MPVRLRPTSATIAALLAASLLVVALPATRADAATAAEIAAQLWPEPRLATAGPVATDRLVFGSNRDGNFDLYAIDTDGTDLQRLTDQPVFDSWWPKLSPDRGRLVFYRSPAGVHDSDYGRASLWSLDLTTGAVTLLLPPGAHGWQVQGHAEWSPDGTRLAMFGGSAMNPQVFVTNPDGGDPRQVTNRGGVNVDPSWAPDGQSLLFVGCPTATCYANQLEVYRTPVAGGTVTRLTNDTFRDHDPYTSPNGQTVAWLRESAAPTRWGIMRMSTNGSGKATVIDDGGVNSKPAWSVDSSTIYFHRRGPGAGSFALHSIRPDGSRLTVIPGRAPSLFTDEYPVNSSS